MESKELELYLTKLDKCLNAISVSEKAEIITEIKSHVLDALNNDPQKKLTDVLNSIGEPENVANKYLLERGLKIGKAPKHPVIKWLVIGFLGTFAMVLIAFFASIWIFTPFVSIDENSGSIKFFGGTVKIEDRESADQIRRELKGDAKDFKELSKLIPSSIQIQSNEIAITSASGQKEFTMESGGSLVISNRLGGDIKITGSRSNKARIEYSGEEWSSDKCHLFLDKKDSAIRIGVTGSSSAWFSDSSCSLDFNIIVPEKTDTTVLTGSGDIQINNLKSNLDFKVGSGDVQVMESVIKNINGKAGSGDINIRGTLYNVRLATGSGNIFTAFEDILGEGRFDARTGSGNVKVSLKNDKAAKINFMSGAGRLKNYARQTDEKPDLQIDVKTGSGNLDVDNLK